MLSPHTDPPELDEVEHRFVTTPAGIRIHVAVAGPPTGPTAMLVHGFPQHWWEWHRLIEPLVAEGHRLLIPDLRGAGWSDAPRGVYRKAEMAADLKAVLDELAPDQRVKLVAHDWGGPVAFILMADHPGSIGGFLGFNTLAPVLRLDRETLKHLPAFWYQFPMLAPGLGPRLLGSRAQRYLRFLGPWVGGGYSWPAADAGLYLSRMRDPARAYAGSQWYRTFQAREIGAWIRGRYADRRFDVPIRWVTGLDDPVIKPVLHRSYAFSADETFEEVPGVGHWIVEQAHDLVLDRVRAFL